MRRHRTWVAVVALLLACLPAAALQRDKAFAHFVLDSWSIQHGLPQITAICLAQDRTGYIWVGTQTGLARFDGVRFLPFSPATHPELPGIWVRTLLADRRGDLWVGTYKGLARHRDGRFRHIAPADAARFPELDVFAIAEQADGTILAGTSAGLFRVAGDRLHHVGGPVPALSLLPRADGTWVGSTGAVTRLTPGGPVALPLPDAAAGAAVTRLVQGGNQVWAATSAGLYRHAAGGWEPAATGTAFDRSPVTALLRDGDGNLWAASTAGLARFEEGGRLVEFVPDSQPGAFRQVISALEDREGNLWLGSQLNGVARLWNGWTRRYASGEGLHDPIVWSLWPASDGRVWTGTTDGLSLFDGRRFRLVVPGHALPHPQVYNLLAEDDRVWLGTRRGLVLWRNGRVEAPPEFAPMAAAQINGIVRDADGSVWFPTSDGLFHWRAGALRRYGPDDGLADPRVRVITRDAAGRLLLGTQSGLFELRGERVHPRGAGAGLPAGIDISALYRLRDGRLAVGTLDEHVYVEAGGRWHALGSAQGLPANTPFFMVEHGGYLWIAGIRGIARVPVADLPRAGKAVHRVRGEMLLNERGDPNAGQQGFCCNGAGMSKGFLRQGVLWLPTRDGVVALDTRAIHKNRLPPPVVVERLRTPEGWRTVPRRPRAPIVLPADARDLGFEFAALSFQDPESVQLRYRLKGYDQAWHTAVGMARSANYTNLPPGDYTFEVFAANNAGVWNREGAVLPFRIRPLFHETWAFRALLGALAALLLFAGYRLQLRRHARQRAALEAEVRARTLELHASSVELQHANARLEEASQTDPLTGLRNRRYLGTQIPVDLAFYNRQLQQGAVGDEVMLFVLVDIDHFKSINDRYGHRAGDLVLQQFAETLCKLVRTGDYVARWGGEEFLLVFRPMPLRHLEIIANRLRVCVAERDFDIGNDRPLRLTCSIGLAQYPLLRSPDAVLGWESMVELADQALYYVKTHGRNGWAAFRATPLTNPTTLLADLQRDGPGPLLARDQLQVIGEIVGEG